MQNTNCLRNDVIIIKVVVRGKKDGVSFQESLQSIKNLKLTFHTRLNYLLFCFSIFAFFCSSNMQWFFSALITSSIEYGNEFFCIFRQIARILVELILMHQPPSFNHKASKYLRKAQTSKVYEKNKVGMEQNLIFQMIKIIFYT